MEQASSPSVLFVRKKERYQKIRVQDILYICTDGSCLEIITTEERFSVLQDLPSFVRQNPISALVQVHCSYIVNLAWVDSFDRGHIYVEHHQIPLGNEYRQKFIESIRCFE